MAANLSGLRLPSLYLFFKKLKKIVEGSVELTLLDKISVKLHVENCAFESLRFTAQAFRKVAIPLQLKMVTSNKKNLPCEWLQW